ncbi:MAG TPA: adenylate/guanylate cyclase domain-containing protein [Candidatus Rifleibacterium sp.]|nr:adenylate/guanylate cyclase domain-containing protein [Candidatus Rifleibacterium sp.]
MKKLLILIFATLALALPAWMLHFSLVSSVSQLQLEHEKQLETRLRNDLQAQSQLTGTVFEIYQHFAMFLAQINQSYSKTDWAEFSKSAEWAFDDFMSVTAGHFLLPFEASIAYQSAGVPVHLAYHDGKKVNGNSVVSLTDAMCNFQKLQNSEKEPQAIRQLAKLVVENLGFYYNLKLLRADATSVETSRTVLREGDTVKLLITTRSRRDFLMNTIFDLTGAGIRAAARRKAARWNQGNSGLIFFGGGAQMKAVSSVSLASQPQLVENVVKIATSQDSRATVKKSGDHLVVFTPFDPKMPWQTAMVATLPKPEPQRGMQCLFILFAVTACCAWKLLIDKLVFARSINLSLQNFIIMVFVLVTLLPFTSGIYLMNEYVIANFKIQKNQASEALAADLMDMDISTFSKFRDSVNRAKGLSSIEAIASFTGMPATSPVGRLMEATMERLLKLNGQALVSEIWLADANNELAEVTYQLNIAKYVFKKNQDGFTNEVFTPRFRQFLQKETGQSAVSAAQQEQIQFDEIKGEVIDSILLHLCGETTYFNLQKDFGSIIRFDSLLDSNAIVSIPITFQGKVKYVFSYVFASAELRNHFPRHRLATNPGKPVTIVLYGNNNNINTQPENLQQVSKNLPALTSLVRQSFLTSSRLMMHDINASGAPVLEALPARYSDHIIGGQRNTRSLESISSELTTNAARYFAILAAAGLLLAILTAMYFIIPIRQLTEATRLIIAEDYSIRLHENHPDEFSLSAASFNKMASGLAEGKLLRHFVSESVREMKTTPDLLAEGQARISSATILFSSIKNFADIQKQLDPEQTFALMQAHLSAAVEVARQYGGEIDKMIEDKVMIVFPAEADGIKASANAALKAAEHIRLALWQNSHRQAAIGINSGELVTGVMGAANVRLSKTVVGDTVNLAARLASLAAGLPEGGTVVSGATVHLGDQNTTFTRLPISSVKGKTHAVEAFLAG